MKHLNNYITEKLIINKDSDLDYNEFDDLCKFIKDIFNKEEFSYKFDILNSYTDNKDYILISTRKIFQASEAEKLCKKINKELKNSKFLSYNAYWDFTKVHSAKIGTSYKIIKIKND